MLRNGLGTILNKEVANLVRRHGRDARFVDLFSGTGSVACFVAESSDVLVAASDLQAFARVVTEAVIGRARPVEPLELWARWWLRASVRLKASKQYASALRVGHLDWEKDPEAAAVAARRWGARSTDSVSRAYVGHYFSPLQGLQISALRASLPESDPERTVALAALVEAASSCSASPGHTAQPFDSGAGGGPSLVGAWRRSIAERTFVALMRLAPRHARRAGTASVKDAESVAHDVRSSDLVFLDPPYSAVQYSRFYHVLESVAIGKCGRVSGVGRYPPIAERPQSEYSKRTESAMALSKLLATIGAQGARVVLTFPSGGASNGLSGQLVRSIAAKHFSVADQLIAGQFSTLGGNGKKRPARKTSSELVLVLKPK